MATENSWPYQGTKVHCLLIAESHKEHFAELTKSDFKAVRYLTNWLIKKLRIRGGGLALRFGNPRYTGATVRHLHFQIIQPAETPQGNIHVINFPIG